MARKIRWNDEGQSVNAKGDPDGKFVMSSITHVESGRAEWFLSEGPLDQAPAPCESREECEALAQAIIDGPAVLGEFEAKRTAVRDAARAERRSAQRKASFGELLDDPDFLDALRAKLAEGEG